MIIKPRNNIREDVKQILLESDPLGTDNPKLTFMAVVNESQESVQLVCNILGWIKEDNIEDIRFVIIDEIDDKEIWSKLRIFDTKRAPKTIIFDDRYSLVDVISGVISKEYIRSIIYTKI